VLADEHQDVNQSQNKLIELIVSFHDHPNVFVVGDEKQAIYRFQGASLDNFLYFGDVYKDVLTIALDTNYRSDQMILDVAHDAIKTDDPTLKDLRIPLKAFNTFSTELEKRQFAHTGFEEAWVVSEIKSYLDKGVKNEEIAVIVRTNKEVELFSQLLRKAGISAKASADSDILEHPLLDNILNLIRAVVNPADDKALISLLHSPYMKFSSSEIVSIFNERQYGQNIVSLFDEILKTSESGLLKEKISEVVKLLSSAKSKTFTKTPAEVLEYLLNESGFISYVLDNDPLEGVRVVRRIYDEVIGMYTRGEIKNLNEIISQFDRIKNHGLPIVAPYLPSVDEAVSVLTAHKAKGLEYEVVFLPHLTDSAWGGGRKSELFDLPVVKHDIADVASLMEDDERRLFYVALTRAKRVIQCSYSDTGIDGRVFTPSRFLVDLPEVVLSCDTKDFCNNFQAVDTIKPQEDVHISNDFIVAALKNRGWSATSLNNYLKSPWEYIYKNALRIPSVKTPELHFGTAVHAVLDKLVRNYVREGKWLNVSEIRNLLETALKSMSLTVEDFTRLFERGLEAVVGYLDTLKTQATKYSKTEFNVEATLDTGIEGFELVKLTGNFDRLDCNEDGFVLRVIDYKTGKPKTRGEISGTTKNSDGNYKRQLTFYALLLSLQNDDKLRCNNGRLSFVEPDGKGVIKEEDFVISDEEIM
jgi:DNA helicase-2/ATP-dependent DNA helicase PcrA